MAAKSPGPFHAAEQVGRKRTNPGGLDRARAAGIAFLYSLLVIPTVRPVLRHRSSSIVHFSRSQGRLSGAFRREVPRGTSRLFSLFRLRDDAPEFSGKPATQRRSTASETQGEPWIARDSLRLWRASSVRPTSFRIPQSSRCTKRMA